MAVKGLQPEELLGEDVRRHAAAVLGAPASTLGEIGAELVSLAALTAPDFDDQMSICYWWQVGGTGRACWTRHERDQLLSTHHSCEQLEQAR